MESLKRPGHQREREKEELDSLLVVWDEANKERDNHFVTLGRKQLSVRVIMCYCLILLHIIQHRADSSQTNMQTVKV